jgi:hypothetical protein
VLDLAKDLLVMRLMVAAGELVHSLLDYVSLEVFGPNYLTSHRGRYYRSTSQPVISVKSGSELHRIIPPSLTSVISTNS